MGQALAQYLPESARMPAFGGTSYWVKGPDSLDTASPGRNGPRRRASSSKAWRCVLSFGENPPKNYFRLGFSSIPVDHIEPGIQTLADIVHNLA